MSDRRIDVASAINEALKQEMRRDNAVIVFGEDIGARGGTFGCTRGLLDEFGKERIRDCPISEIALLGAAIGAGVTGMRPVAEISFIDFIGLTMENILNQLAKFSYMFAGNFKTRTVLRTTTGSRYPVGSGAAQHSQSLEALLMHIPGLKVVIPSTPYDAKGLLISAIRDEDPVVFIEHKLQYFAVRMPSIREKYPLLVGHVPEEEYAIPFGKAEIKKEGKDVTIIATMMMVHKSMRVAEELSKEGINVEVIDPRTLVPFDKKTIIDSVKKTNKAIVVSEDCKTAGVAAEISSIIVEDAFDYLDAPVIRISAPDTPIPYSRPLEDKVIPKEEDIKKAIKEIVQ